MKINNNKPQKIFVFQQKKRAYLKVRWIKKHTNAKYIDIYLVNIEDNLPEIIDNAYNYLPKKIDADLVIDYLIHPDLSIDLAKKCVENKIPIISSGKKTKLGKIHYTPTVCCALPKSDKLGEYSKHFGKPELNITLLKGKVSKIKVIHGSPCGSTWKAANKILGTTVENAATQFGLYTQYFCTANHSNWDPIYGKSQIHIAAEIHKQSMIQAITKKAKT